MLPRLMVSALALFVAQSALADESHEKYRIFVSDHEQPRITAFDLDAPAKHWTFATIGQSKLFAVANGSVMAAIQSDDDAVHFLSTGIALENHGDHTDMDVSEPAAFEQHLTGPRPFHIVAHGGIAAINYDKGGYAEILTESDLTNGTIEPTRFDQNRAHHGFVAQLGGMTVSTVASDAPTEGDAAPARLGLQAFTAEGEPVGDLATCTAVHGEAFSGAFLAAGCKEGVLTVTEYKGIPVYDMLAYPVDFPEGTTGTLLGAKSMQVFLGNFGANGLVVIDPVDAPHMHYITLPFRRVDFVLSAVDPTLAYVLTEDGTMHSIDLLEAKITASRKVTTPYSMDGHWNDARPRLAVAGGNLLLTDPDAGLVRVLAHDTMEETASIAVDGKPYNIAVAGGSGISH